jgi:Protein of unknown function (DUF2538).
LKNLNQAMFIDENHRENFEKVVERWDLGNTNEYLQAMYILAVPLVFESVGHDLLEFESPIDWIWDYEHSEEPNYYLSSGAVHLGKLALNLWNGYENFNLNRALAVLDINNVQVIINAIQIRTMGISY